MQEVTKESTPEIVGVAASSLVFPSDVTSADAAGSFLQSDQHADIHTYIQPLFIHDKISKLTSLWGRVLLIYN